VALRRAHTGNCALGVEGEIAISSAVISREQRCGKVAFPGVGQHAENVHALFRFARDPERPRECGARGDADEYVKGTPAFKAAEVQAAAIVAALTGK
jgi:hypothetical protein